MPGAGYAIHAFWRVITDLGDSAVTTTLSGFFLLHFLAGERWRQAVSWSLVVVLCALGTISVKLAMHACVLMTPAGNISGHTSMSALVYGALPLLLCPKPANRRDTLLFAAAGALVLAIACSRIILQAHRWPEVLAGLAVGLACLLLFYRLSGSAERRDAKIGLLIGATSIIIVMHGFRWPVEVYLVHLAALLPTASASCGRI